MKKLAVFVEGQTEQIFTEKLFREIAGDDVRIVKRQMSGGTSGDLAILELGGSSIDVQHKFFVLIVNCGADNKVKSAIRDDYDNLVERGFSAIIGIRDVFPL